MESMLKIRHVNPENHGG